MTTTGQANSLNSSVAINRAKHLQGTGKGVQLWQMLIFALVNATAGYIEQIPEIVVGQAVCHTRGNLRKQFQLLGNMINDLWFR